MAHLASLPNFAETGLGGWQIFLKEEDVFLEGSFLRLPEASTRSDFHGLGVTRPEIAVPGGTRGDFSSLLEVLVREGLHRAGAPRERGELDQAPQQDPGEGRRRSSPHRRRICSPEVVDALGKFWPDSGCIGTDLCKCIVVL